MLAMTYYRVTHFTAFVLGIISLAKQAMFEGRLFLSGGHSADHLWWGVCTRPLWLLAASGDDKKINDVDIFGEGFILLSSLKPRSSYHRTNRNAFMAK